jgi:hypothetical protein
MEKEWAAMKELTDRNAFLEQESKEQKAEIAALKAQLARRTQPATQPKPTKERTPPTTPPTPMPEGTAASTWATRTAQHRPPQPRSAKKIAAAARAFTPADPNAPQGYDYVYIPRSRRLTFREARARLRTLGVDTFRVLDITFPARSVLGLLVHQQYRTDLESELAKAKIKPIRFDPFDPAHIADPAHASKSKDERATLAIDLHTERCIRALRRMRYHLAVAVGRSFLEHGCIDDATLAATLRKCPGAPRRYAHADTPDSEDDEGMSICGSVSDGAL